MYSLAITLAFTHYSLACCRPWIYGAALKIKFLLRIIFLVIRKYTCSPREECSDRQAGCYILIPSSVSPTLSYPLLFCLVFRCLDSFLCLFLESSEISC